MGNCYIRAQVRRAALKRRLDAKHPLFAGQFYERDLAQYRGYFNGQLVTGPANRRRSRTVVRAINKTAQAAMAARQLELFAWRAQRPSLTSVLWSKCQKVLKVLAKAYFGRASRWRAIVARMAAPSSASSGAKPSKM